MSKHVHHKIYDLLRRETKIFPGGKFCESTHRFCRLASARTWIFRLAPGSEISSRSTLSRGTRWRECTCSSRRARRGPRRRSSAAWTARAASRRHVTWLAPSDHGTASRTAWSSSASPQRDPLRRCQCWPPVGRQSDDWDESRGIRATFSRRPSHRATSPPPSTRSNRTQHSSLYPRRNFRRRSCVRTAFSLPLSLSYLSSSFPFLLSCSYQTKDAHTFRKTRQSHEFFAVEHFLRGCTVSPIARNSHARATSRKRIEGLARVPWTSCRRAEHPIETLGLDLAGESSIDHTREPRRENHANLDGVYACVGKRTNTPLCRDRDTQPIRDRRVYKTYTPCTTCAECAHLRMCVCVCVCVLVCVCVCVRVRRKTRGGVAYDAAAENDAAKVAHSVLVSRFEHTWRARARQPSVPSSRDRVATASRRPMTNRTALDGRPRDYHRPANPLPTLCCLLPPPPLPALSVSLAISPSLAPSLPLPLCPLLLLSLPSQLTHDSFCAKVCALFAFRSLRESDVLPLSLYVSLHATLAPRSPYALPEARVRRPALVSAPSLASSLPSVPSSLSLSLSLSLRVFPSVAARNTAFRCSQGNAHLAACTGLRGARAKRVPDSRPQPSVATLVYLPSCLRSRSSILFYLLSISFLKNDSLSLSLSIYLFIFLSVYFYRLR